MLFILNSSGVPSIAQMVQVGPMVRHASVAEQRTDDGWNSGDDHGNELCFAGRQ